MSTSSRPSTDSRRPLRLWPGVALLVLFVLVRLIMPLVVPTWSLYGILGGVGLSLLMVVWWLLLSRAPWVDRVGALVVWIAALGVTWLAVDESIATAGMGMLLPLFAITLLGPALVAGAAVGRQLADRGRRAAMAAAVAAGCLLLTLVRTEGIYGEGGSQIHLRWTPTPEERLLAQTRDEMTAAPPAAAPASAAGPGTAAGTMAPASSPAAASAPPAVAPTKTPETPAPASPEARTAPAADPIATSPGASWPGFRGPARDGIVRGVRIDANWSANPPVELWRKPIGPGWSSFAVRGDLIYTQEQRGEEEIVSCYRLSTGDPVWRHRDPVRFWESNGGPGPRGTPTLHGGRVYALGATGILNALDAATGAVIWSRNAATDTGVPIPDWGFASSPLIVDDVVIVAMSGRLAGYEIATGAPRWMGPEGGAGYSSPHLVTIDGVTQVVLLRGSRTISVAPADGALLWEHVGQPGVGIVQPSLAGSDLLLSNGDGMGGGGIRRLAVSRTPAGWSTEERWTSRGLKPYFNDFVVHEGHAYGFDGSILAAIDLATGDRKWKGGRYGHGQMVLLPDQDLLLVLSEDGELALVSATPDKHTEVARLPGIEGKTWNHPALAGDVLLVRNGEEMAAFRLSRLDLRR